MSKESKIFLKELHLLITDTVKSAEKLLSNQEISSNDLMGGNLTMEEIAILRSISFTPRQLRALSKLLIAVGRLSMAGVLSVIDGVIMNESVDLPDLSLINRETGKDIADEAPLNENFYYYTEDYRRFLE